jgi:ribosome-associated translation inhibitor RaiA
MEDVMQIDIHAQKFSLTSALKDYAEKQLTLALEICECHIQRVAMHLSDINGPRGGKDKCCLVKIKLFGLPDVVVKDVETNLYASINRAVERATQTTLRKIGKQQAQIRQNRLCLD